MRIIIDVTIDNTVEENGLFFRAHGIAKDTEGEERVVDLLSPATYVEERTPQQCTRNVLDVILPALRQMYAAEAPEGIKVETDSTLN